ncbi:unnamed protein product [Periconia digitata]|uniref:DUF7896 domain-containing protein n=1 Tax=Periconia digitata TaxID=1303443 RepID=A0A9W4XQI0_9PLEO|nr:unnamed protein product [Periconia digitata]
MATPYAATMEQLKLDFYARHSSLPEQTRQQLWLQTLSGQPVALQQVPRSMAYPHPDMLDFSTSQFGSMDRIQSAPPTSTMDPHLSIMDPNNTMLARSASTMTNWQPACDDQQSAYAIYSDSAPISEYSPSDYINNFIDPSNSASSSYPLSFPQQSPHLHVPLTPSTQWSPQMDPSTAPSTPSSTALMTPVIHSSNMSRQSSYNTSLFDDSSSMQFSDSSVFPILSEDGTVSFPIHAKTINHGVDNLHFLDQFTGSPSEAFPSSSSVPVFSSCTSAASAFALASSQNKPDLAEDMTRSASSSSESQTSIASSPSTGSRHVRRGREINAQAGRCRIAPKATLNDFKTESTPSNAQMVRIQSEDGSSKNVGVIAKAAYVRPQHPKIMCPHCNERPDGFRGTHELERHVARAHTAVRKGFICVDASPDKKFLANCKHCRNKKVYGAYYNAAAHLRRAHFHPRKRGRKGKHDEKRGGIGGGDDPPMDFLKQHWIRDIEVENKATTAQSPDSASSDNSNETADMNSYDTSVYDFNANPQSTNDAHMSMPMNVDTTQYFDFDSNSTANGNLCMPDSDVSYSSIMYTTNDPSLSSNDIENFQFDAHRL